MGEHDAITHQAAVLLPHIPEQRTVVGAEVGVGRGANAATLLARRPLLRLHLVDHYGLHGERTEPTDPTGLDVLNGARRRLSFAGDRARWLIGDAVDVASSFADNTLDLVFLDADHRLEPTLDAMRAWWPKVRPGGWMAGHDIDHPDPRFSHWDVRGAVDRWLHEHSRTWGDVTVYGSPALVWMIHKDSAT